MEFLALLFLIEGWSVDLDGASTNLLLGMAYQKKKKKKKKKKFIVWALRNRKFISEGALSMERLPGKIIYLTFLSTEKLGSCEPGRSFHVLVLYTFFHMLMLRMSIHYYHILAVFL